LILDEHLLDEVFDYPMNMFATGEILVRSSVMGPLFVSGIYAARRAGASIYRIS